MMPTIFTLGYTLVPLSVLMLELLATATYDTVWSSSSPIERAVVDPKTGRVYVVSDGVFTQFTEKLQPEARTNLTDLSLKTCQHDADLRVTAMGLVPNSSWFFLCTTFCDGLCAIYNTSNITHWKWLDESQNGSYIRAPSILVFNKNGGIFVGSDTRGMLGNSQKKDQMPYSILSYRVLNVSNSRPNCRILKSVNMKSESNVSIQFISGLLHRNKIFFLTNQRSDINGNVSTRLIHLCADGETVLPYVELPLPCIFEGTKFSTGLSMAVRGGNLSVSFGTHLQKSSFEPDPTEGSVLCQYKLDDIEMEVNRTTLNLESKPPEWIAENVTGTRIISEKNICYKPQDHQNKAFITENQFLYDGPPDYTKDNYWWRNRTALMYLLSSTTTNFTFGTSDGVLVELKGNASVMEYQVRGDKSFANQSLISYIPYQLVMFSVGEYTIYRGNECTFLPCQNCSLSDCTWCDGGCRKESECRTEPICRMFDSYSPRRGPRSGGTLMTIQGCFQWGQEFKIQVNGRRCNTKTQTRTRFMCVVDDVESRDNKHNEKDNGVKENSKGCNLGHFTFGEDPEITTISPQSSIKSGGVNITISGANFDVIQSPIVTLKLQAKNYTLICPNKGNTSLRCVVPEINETIIDTLNGSLEVIMDANRETFNFTVVPDPTIDVTALPKSPRSISPDGKLELPVNTYGVDDDAVQVDVGQTACLDVKVVDLKVTCIVQWRNDNTVQNVTVTVGYIRLEAGQVKFVAATAATTIPGGTTDRSSSYQFVIIVSGTVSGVVVIVVIVCAVTCYVSLKKKEHRQRLTSEATDTKFSETLLHPQYFQLLPLRQYKLSEELLQKIEDNRLHVPAARLKLGDLIGSGNFGNVYAGELLSAEGEETSQRVAVKTMHENQVNVEMTSFVEEALIMKTFNHENVLQLLGISIGEDQKPMVILPFMANGDLMSYVCDENKVITVCEILHWGMDIAGGMAYLSSLKLVHRDLAARNCMLDEERCAKVADFGLCRDIYEKGYYTSDNKKQLPIRWMAPESIARGNYTSQSDVWSLGVVLWELFTRGAMPYPGVEGWDIDRFLTAGRRLRQPWFCSGKMYDLLLRTWNMKPADRPSFTEIAEDLTDMIPGEENRRTGDPLYATCVTFPDCSRYIDIPDHNYFTLESEDTRMRTNEVVT